MKKVHLWKTKPRHFQGANIIAQMNEDEFEQAFDGFTQSVSGIGTDTSTTQTAQVRKKGSKRKTALLVSTRNQIHLVLQFCRKTNQLSFKVVT